MLTFPMKAFVCALCIFFMADYASAITCIKALSKVKNSKVTTRLVSIERSSCKSGEIPGPNGQVGDQGTQGPRGETGIQGPQGDPGPAGPTLIRQTENAESFWPIDTTPTVVALIDSEFANYSGTYSTQLVHPEGVSYMPVLIQAHLLNVTGTGVTCDLQRKINNNAWTKIATVSISSDEGYMNANFASFTPGTAISSRIVCKTASGFGTARGTIGMVAGDIS